MLRDYSTTHPSRSLYPVSVLPGRALHPLPAHRISALFSPRPRGTELFPCDADTTATPECHKPLGVHLRSARHQINAVSTSSGPSLAAARGPFARSFTHRVPRSMRRGCCTASCSQPARHNPSPWPRAAPHANPSVTRIGTPNRTWGLLLRFWSL